MNWPVLIALILFSGLILLLIEIFVVPGFGPVGIASIVFLGIGAYLSWIKLSYAWGISITLISIICFILSIIVLKKMGIANRFVLRQNIDEKGLDNKKHQYPAKNNISPLISIGDTGVTKSDLRPSGIAEFHDKRLNVITDGIFIKRGTNVKIVKIEGNRIFVEEE